MIQIPNKKISNQRIVLPKTEPEVKIIDYNGLKWIDITHPSNKEIDMLKEMYDFHELLLEDCMTEHQRAKIDTYEGYNFIVLHFPRYKKDLRRLESAEVDLFISREYLVTLHEGELKPLVELANRCSAGEDARKEYMEEGSALLLYEITKALFDYCFPMLDKIGFAVNEINRQVFTNRSKVMLETISRTKMQIINYRSVMKPMRPVILTLEKVIKKYLPKDMELYYDDLTDKAEKISDMLENYKEVIESADNTFSTLTNHTINGLMRVFTIIQVAILPMILVSGLFSMNVKGIPMNDFPLAFWVVFSMILVPTLAIAIVLMIKKDKWF